MYKLIELSIDLVGAHTPVTRKIAVSPDTTLYNLHLIIQAAMGWESEHLHSFQFGQTRYPLEDDDFVDPQIELDEEEPSSEDTTLESALGTRKSFTYEYDFGDSWLHQIKVISRNFQSEQNEPQIIEGVGSCPPEDVGGVWGYEIFCNQINNVKDPQHKQMVEWAYDFCGYPKSTKWPGKFDLQMAQDELSDITFRTPIKEDIYEKIFSAENDDAFDVDDISENERSTFTAFYKLLAKLQKQFAEPSSKKKSVKKSAISKAKSKKTTKKSAKKKVVKMPELPLEYGDTVTKKADSKPAAKKTGVKKTTSKEAAPKETVSKKTASKKPVAKKTAAKKATAKKTASKKPIE